MEAEVAGAYVGTIRKAHAPFPLALSLIDTPGPVESYEVEMDDSDDSVWFVVADYSSARAALAAAKAYVREQVAPK